MFQLTTATNKILSLRKRIRVVAGGTSASKTISILMWIIDYAQAAKESTTISVVSETMPHLKRGAIRDFLNIMMDHGYFEDKRWNKSDFIYDFSRSGLKIIVEFFSADQPGRVRGPRRDVLFINECNNINYEIFTQLEIRTKKIVWCDFNPVAEFWFYTELLPTRKDLDFLTLTYKDNEALDAAIVRTIEARRGNASWWKVYGEGQLGEAEGRIFKGWNVEMESVPHDAKLIRYGLDFGYSNDPSAIVAIYKYNNAFILDEVMYLKGLPNKEIASILQNQPKALVIADSSEPKSIDEIKGYNINIIGAQKGAGSILQGIQYVQDQQIFVTKRSTNIIKEYRNYLWITDKDNPDKHLNEPQDFLNHTMDAIRYGLDSSSKKGEFKHESNVGGVKPFIPGIG